MVIDEDDNKCRSTPGNNPEKTAEDKNEPARAAGREVARHENMHRALFETMSSGVVYQNSDGEIIYANPAACRILGLTLDEMLGVKSSDPMWRAIRPDGTPVPGEEHPTMITLRTGEPRKGVILGVFNQQVNDYTWLNVESVPVFSESGKDIFQVYSIFTDVTEHVLAGKKLQESDYKYKNLFDKMLNAFALHELILDESGSPCDYRFLEANHAFEMMTGLVAEQIIGKTVREIIPGIDDFWIKKYGEVALGGKTILFDQFEPQLDKYYQVQAYSNKRGEFATVFNDISSNIIKEKQLKQSEAKYRSLVDNSPDLICSFDKECRFILVNKAIVSFSGFSAGMFVGHTLREVGFPESSCLFWDSKIMPVLATGESSEFEFYYTKDNRNYVFDIRLIPEHDNEGNVVSCLYIGRDITERLESSRALEKSENLYRTIVETSIDGIILTDAEGSILFSNTQAAKIFDYELKESLQGMNSFDLLFGNSDFPGKPSDFFRDTGPVPKEIITPKRGGGTIDIEYSSSTVFDQGGKPVQYLIILRDITQKKKSEEELRRVAKLESIGVLAGGIAHNFKNLLASMYFNISLARERKERTDHYLEKIEKSLDLANSLATRFQTFSSGGVPVKEASNILLVIEEAASMAFSGSEVEFTLEAEESVFPVDIDKRQMNEVFLNLFLNSKQAMHGGGAVRVHVAPVSGKEQPADILTDDSVRIIVEDNGSGIKPEILNKVFDPFFTTKQQGHGLGLSTVHLIIQKHSGKIYVESEPGKGTSFTIYLPASTQSFLNDMDSDTDIVIGNHDRILFMDDNADIRDVVREICQVLNYEVTCVAKGEEAIAQFRSAIDGQTPFDAVILDLTIKGGMGGEETIKELAAIDPGVKVLVFSGHSTRPIIAKYREYGFAARIDKPVSISKFSKILHEVINSES